MAFFEYKPSSALFYYTDTSGFKGIIASKQLWLSDTTTLNDPREFNLGMKLLSEAITNYRDDDVSGVSNRDMQSLLFEVMNFRQKSSCYACCFSSRGDELPMWRYYAGDGAGISIGFRPTALSSVPGRVQLVRYAEDDIEQYFQQVVLKLAQRLGSVRSVERALTTVEALASISCVKHRSWEYEKEVRVIYNQVHTRPSSNADIGRITSLHDDGEFVEWNEPLQRDGANGPVRYFSFPYGKRSQGRAESKGAIETVIIGPSCELRRSDVEDILRSEGFEGFTVRQSDCEFR
ncbi:DUF2971 domain-containing protein [Brucella anthropi]|uniref:DUF2971 domain-containing protein n=1 Tax=Brucella anthropi TaxID=529 RepID=UPI00124C0579|nr:DUF2971 domain-containing protein [Brucella anthropi]KAB2747859.1 DUF2971 domain-containing protein [Brucella anthropi]